MPQPIIPQPLPVLAPIPYLIIISVKRKGWPCTTLVMYMRSFIRLYGLEGEALFAVIAALHILASLIANNLSYKALASMRLHLSERRWEDNGKTYQRLFCIRAWKDHVPSVGRFDKRNFQSDRNDYISLFILESVRAEVTHYLCLLFTAAALFIHEGGIPDAMPFFFLMINLPCIMIQRFNRPRLEKVLKMTGKGLVIPEEEPGLVRSVLARKGRVK